MTDTKNLQKRNQKGRTIFVWAGVFSLLLMACDKTQPPKIYTIGVVNYVPTLDPVFDGFKTGLSDLDYVEGKNITYIYNGVLEADPEVINVEIQNMLAQEVDLLFTINPVDQEIVESLQHPGGNVTGVQRGNSIPKSLEWLLKLTPETVKVYVPYHPEDNVSVMSIAPLPEAASMLGVELVLDEVRTPEEVLAAIETLPQETAIFFVPMPSLEPYVNDFIKAAIEYGIATTSLQPYHIETGVLVINDINLWSIGKQAARLADQILRGIKPADLPVETAEIFLTINLKTDEVLIQADIIVR
jgi:putative ABC transport system substrate-binding protein